MAGGQIRGHSATRRCRASSWRDRHPYGKKPRFSRGDQVYGRLPPRPSTNYRGPQALLGQGQQGFAEWQNPYGRQVHPTIKSSPATNNFHSDQKPLGTWAAGRPHRKRPSRTPRARFAAQRPRHGKRDQNGNRLNLRCRSPEPFALSHMNAAFEQRLSQVGGVAVMLDSGVEIAAEAGYKGAIDQAASVHVKVEGGFVVRARPERTADRSPAGIFRRDSPGELCPRLAGRSSRHGYGPADAGTPLGLPEAAGGRVSPADLAATVKTGVRGRTATATRISASSRWNHGQPSSPARGASGQLPACLAEGVHQRRVPAWQPGSRPYKGRQETVKVHVGEPRHAMLAACRS